MQGENNVKELLNNPQELRKQFRELFDFARQHDVSLPATEPSDEQLDSTIKAMDEPQKRQLASYLTLLHANNKEGYKRHWQIENLGSTYVLEPHYTVTNVFAYRPGEESWILKIVGLFGSMFLHESLAHLLGNMLFLWVFGRALEDALGKLIYLGAYIFAGVAGTLLFHFVTIQFSPESAGVPLLGASGAINGLIGLFVVRFYRTRVRISPFLLLAFLFINFLLKPLLNLFAILSQPLYDIWGEGGAALGVLGFCAALGALFYLVYHFRQWTWVGFKVPAALAMICWVLFFDWLPALAEMETGISGNVAHWVHIGSFLFGAAYAFAIGARDDGAAEYMLDDAQKAISEGNAADALQRSQKILTGNKKSSQNAVPSMKAQAHEVQGEAYARQNNKEAALENYEKAILGYLADNDRDAATRAYLDALEWFPLFVLSPARQLTIASHLVARGDFQKAADNLNKIPYAFPDAPESEIATLRLARLHLEKLNNAAQATQLLEWFIAHYPHSEWMQQAKQTLRAAQNQSGE